MVNKVRNKIKECTSDGAASIEEIKQLIEKVQYIIKIKYKQKLKKIVWNFNDDPAAFLI